MSLKKYFGFDEKLNDALVEARSGKITFKEDKILQLEHKLETARLTQAEIEELQKEIKRLKSF